MVLRTFVRFIWYVWAKRNISFAAAAAVPHTPKGCLL